MTDPYIQTLCDLVAIPSCSYAEGGDEKEVQAYVAKRFAAAGARVRSFDATEIEGFLDHPLCCGPDRNYTDRPTVLGEVGPADGPALIVMAHSDTVSINNDPALWKITQPFTPLIRDGYVYGRGCGDDKWGVACLIHILDQLKADNTPINKRIIFISTMDEENGVGNGLLAIHLANLGAEAALYLDGNEDTITVGNLGGSTINLNLATSLSREELKTCEAKLIAACKMISEQRKPMFTGLFASNSHADRSAIARLSESDVLGIHFYTALGEDGKAYGKQLETLAKQTLPEHAEGMTFTYRTPWFVPTVLERDHPFVSLMVDSYRAVNAKEPVVTTVSKQDSFVTRMHGLPTVGYGVGQTRGPGAFHEHDERLEIADAQRALKFAHRAVTGWLEA